MLSDRDRDTLREIERRLTLEDPDFVRAFHPVERRAPGDRRRRAQPRLFVAKAALLALLFVGPNRLTEHQVANRTRPPAPRRSAAPPGNSPDDAAGPPPPHAGRSAELPGPADFSGIVAHPLPSVSTSDTTGAAASPAPITPTAAA